MVRFFLATYQFFTKRKTFFYVFLGLLLLAIGFVASKIRFEEDINSFMPKTKDAANITKVFKNIKVKDKIVVIFESKDSVNLVEPDKMITACDEFLQQLQETETGKTHIKSILSKVDNQFIENISHYTLDNLPIFLDTADYARLDTLLLEKNLSKRMEQNYGNLISPLGVVTKKFVFNDPLGMAGNSFKNFQDLQLNLQYDIYNDHIFSFDHKYLLAIISPVYGAGEISKNEKFADEIENSIAQLQKQYPSIDVSYFGGIPIGIYNARQIKFDSIISMFITTLIIGLVIIFAFRRKSAIPLILAPVLFGGVFSLAIMYLLQGTISTIAVGAGSAILGIAFSYSIHVFCHSLHSHSAEQIIKELAYPMTIGGFTTIAAFASLAFMSSDVLHDFGLFSCFTLIGTTLFSLIFLPHLLVFKPQKETRLMGWIEKFNSYPFEKKYGLLAFVAIIFIVGLIFCKDVKFNSDMMKLNYMPDKFAKAENILNNTFQDEYKTIYFISVGNTSDQALQNYTQANKVFDSLKSQKLIKEYSSAHNLLISQKDQKRRIELWKQYWTAEKKENLKNNLAKEGEKYKFKPIAFNNFYTLLDKQYEDIDYQKPHFSGEEFLSDWINSSPDLTMAITQVRLLEKNKETVYHAFNNNGNMVILDKPYFASKLSSVINKDFNAILFIVSIIVFISIFISYGRIEITLITFLPMAMSWIIILGLMALFKIEFNIINIIISTFIFGIGDDFSIFVSDGLLSEYKTGKKILNSHKTSIFFSALTVTVGLGAMVFSKHPALHSISVTSIIGMISVVLISYTVQPFIFRLLISGRTAKKKFPHTWYSLFITTVALTIFVSGSIFLTISSYLLLILPIKKKPKKLFFHKMMRYFSYFQVYAMFNERKTFQNPSNETFQKPAIIIANHQSVIDILQMLMLNDKIVMVTKEWVSKSPLFGRVARFADFVDITKGYENAVDHIRECMNNGYSVMVFPEGSRSPDCEIRRFHKGAFYLAEELKADIVPVLLHGHGQAMSKNDYLYLKDSAIATKILPRIPYQEGETYQERGKRISKLFREEHALFVQEIDETKNPYYHYKLAKNYVYKGPVLEWYMRIKVRMEHNYIFFEKLIPKSASITDIGCGYGFLAYMLSFKGSERKITGIDYDEEKIEVANYNFSKTDNLNFIAADASKTSFDFSDIFILNDMLHYMPTINQEKILSECVEKLNPNGKIIIRDGDREKEKKHGLTKLTEVFSTKILKFNKTEHQLHFLSTQEITAFAQKHKLSVSIIENDKYSSNTIYVLESH